MPSSPEQTSKQSQVPNIPNTQQYIKQIVIGVKGVVSPPRLVIVNGVALGYKEGVIKRYIQNCGINAVKFMVSKDPADTCTVDMFHGILAACTAQDDGLGSIFDLSRVEGQVTVYGVGGAPRICTFEALEPMCC